MGEVYGGPHSLECLVAPEGAFEGSCPAGPRQRHGWGLGGVALAIREKAMRSPLFLATEVLSPMWNANLFLTPSDAHLEVEKAIIDQADLLYVDHRGTAKTSLNCETGGVWQLLKYVNDSVLMLQANMENAKGISGQVRRHFVANDTLRLVWPEYRLSGTEDGSVLSWTVPCRTINTREGSFDVGTPEMSLTGRHYDLGLGSDLMNSATTPPPVGLGTVERMKGVIGWNAQIRGLLKSKAVNPRAHMRYDSNRWHDGDLAADLIRKDKANAIRKVIRGVRRDANGEFIPTWPAVFPAAELAKIHASAEMTAATWAANFQSDPLPEGGMAFQRKWFHTYGGGVCQCHATHKTPEKFDNVSICVDPAFADEKTAKTKTDRSAMVASGTCARTGHLYVLETKAGRWSPHEFLVELFRMLDFWRRVDRDLWVGIEDTGGSRALVAMFVSEMARTKRFVPYRRLEPKAHGGRKDTRAVPLHRHAENLGLFVKDDHSDLVEELLRFGVAEHDDLADAMSYAAAELYKAPAAEEAAAAQRPRSVPLNRDDSADGWFDRLEAAETFQRLRPGQQARLARITA